jgi:hypothetical protein
MILEAALRCEEFASFLRNFLHHLVRLPFLKFLPPKIHLEPSSVDFNTRPARSGVFFGQLGRPQGTRRFASRITD